jgi:Methyltransferase domain
MPRAACQASVKRRLPGQLHFIEIGVASGASVATWKSYFSQANIIGVDNNPRCAALADDRVTIEIGSQADPEFLSEVCSKYPPTIVVDDGTHRADHIMTSFKTIFPLLRPGGLYVIEDIAIHFGPAAADFKGEAKEWTSDYFLRLAKSCLARSPQDDDDQDSIRPTLEAVDSVDFFRSAVTIRKVGPTLDIESALRFADRYMQASAPHGMHERLAQFIVKHNGPLDRAEAELKRAIEVGGQSPQTLSIYSDIKFRQGRLPEAADMAERAARTSSNPNGHLWSRAGTLRNRQGDLQSAVAAFQKAVELSPGNSLFQALLKSARERMERQPSS